MQSQRFHKHRGGDLLCNQSVAGLGITHLLQQSLYCPAQRFALGFAFKENNRRQRIQQKPCFTFQPKVASRNEKVIPGSQRQDTVVSFLLRKRFQEASCCTGSLDRLNARLTRSVGK